MTASVTRYQPQTQRLQLTPLYGENWKIFLDGRQGSQNEAHQVNSALKGE
jgi:hypothetical protein